MGLGEILELAWWVSVPLEDIPWHVVVSILVWREWYLDSAGTKKKKTIEKLNPVLDTLEKTICSAVDPEMIQPIDG